MSPSSWQSATVAANGLNFHYNRTGVGSGKPPLVLAHGFSDNGLCWTPVAEALADQYDIVMVDARNHGLSDSPDRDFTNVDLADDLAGVIGALGLQQPIVMGHSMGAVTSLILAGRYPEMPRALVLEDPPPWWTPAAQVPVDPKWQDHQRAWITGLQAKPREAILASIRAESPAWSEAEVQPWADSKIQFNLKGLERSTWAELNWPQLLGQVACPVLLITADTSLKSIVSPQQATELQALLPQTQIAHILGAGHSIRRDQFTAYLDAVNTFLASITPKP